MNPQMAVTQHEGINVYHPVTYSQEYLNINVINIIQ